METKKQNHNHPHINEYICGLLQEDSGIALEADFSNEDCPEQTIWQAVLLQAILDARSKKKSVRAQVDKNEAVKWLCSDCDRKDFEFVCLSAGLDPLYIRQKILEAERRDFVTCNFKKMGEAAICVV